MSYLPKEFISQTIPLVLGRQRQFPSIFRTIPEALKISKRNIVVFKISALSVLTFYLLLAAASQSSLLSDSRAQLESLRQNRTALEKQASFWREITEKYEKYPDAYLKLAQIEYQLGNPSASQDLINKALSLNPELRHSAVLGEFVSRISK